MSYKSSLKNNKYESSSFDLLYDVGIDLEGGQKGATVTQSEYLNYPASPRDGRVVG